MHLEEVAERPTEDHFRLLSEHVPYSLAILRRLQTAAGAMDRPGNVGGGTSPHARILFAYDDTRENANERGKGSIKTHFAAAYVDFSKGPETIAWIYSSDEDSEWPAGADGASERTPEEQAAVDRADTDPATGSIERGPRIVAGWSPERRARCRRLVLAILRRMRALAREQAAAVPQVGQYSADRVKVNIHAAVGEVLFKSTSASPPVTHVMWASYDKWLFRLSDVPVLSQAGDKSFQGRGPDAPTLTWDVTRVTDVPLIVSRTHIPRTEASLMLVPSACLRTPEGPLAAWTFLGIDGSVWTLHCEEPFRGMGFAKAVAARLIRENNKTFESKGSQGTDNSEDATEWCIADVAMDNTQSQGVCRSLGGKRGWATAWTILNYDSFGDDGEN